MEEHEEGSQERLSKDEIYAIEKRLAMFRDEINLRLVADVR